jgi:DNA-binding phage protein
MCLNKRRKILMEKLKKGEHEKAMEKAKEMLDRGCGMGEIVEETSLSEENVMKAKRKWEGRA